MGNFPEVPIERLRASIDPESFPFENTADLELPKDPVLGQDRAKDAIRFGIGIKADDYHIYIAGPSKAGLTYIAKVYLEERAKDEPTPPDWCYVNNFKEPDKPKSIKIAAGKGKELKKDMQELIETLESKLPQVFESEDYRAREDKLKRKFEKRRARIIEELSRLVQDEGFILQVSQMGMLIVPAGKDGSPITQEELADMSEDDKERLKQKSDELHNMMKEAVKKIREEEAELKKSKDSLKKEAALFIVSEHIEPYLEKYADEEQVIEFLKSVQEDVVENIDDFIKKPESQQSAPLPIPMPSKESLLRRYDVNVIVDNSEVKGAPVIIESNPAYPNLFGVIERQAMLGALFTDFTMIKPGALHRANGGYLIMKALDLLKWYFSWEALKRALRDKEIRIEDVGELFGIFGTRTIKPEPIPLDIKIVLTGDPFLFELLYLLDDRFAKLFKVKAHMDDSIDREEDAIIKFSRMVARFCREEGIRHVDRTGIARLVEYSMEQTEDQEKLSLELGDIKDLLQEADYYAGLDGADFINARHVEMAVEKRRYRSNLVEEKINELIEKDIFWVETDGEKTGQVNGISILMTGDYEFGRPTRITATVSVGREGVIAIERESRLSGKIHTKGIMILSSFIKDRFAHNKPLSLTATLCFEQSYGLVEGDSASSTELFALLSALADVPIYQGIAVTGSISQKGEIQPVGGVTKKIEAFYEICKRKGLNGKQGVIIPEKNIRHLMLKKEIVESVKNGRFHIWPISTVEEGIEILTGMKAGELQPDGTYPEGTLFRKVDERLKEFAQIVTEFGKDDDNDDEEEEEEGGKGDNG